MNDKMKTLLQVEHSEKNSSSRGKRMTYSMEGEGAESQRSMKQDKLKLACPRSAF